MSPVSTVFHTEETVNIWDQSQVTTVWNTGETGDIYDNLVLVNLIGVNKGRLVTLKYFSILINVSRKHRVYIGHEQSTSLIWIVVK